MIEASTGTILLDKNADIPVPPASLAKLMTVEYVFHLLKTGKLTLDTEFPVSEYAWRTGGALSRSSTMFAAWHSNISVENLLKGVIVQSANDGCIILAEGISGSEEAFAKKLTERARELGLKSSVFGNSNGLPNPKNQVTMRDMVALARDIHDSYPEFYQYFSLPDFEWNKIRQRNRNPLLGNYDGADGLKTGETDAAGFGIVASAERNGIRLYLAMSGLTSAKDREQDARDLLDWGFNSFRMRQLFAANETIADVSVYGGSSGSVAVDSHRPVAIYEDSRDPDRVNAKVAYQWPLRAPVKKGQQVGTLKLYKGDEQVQQVPVYAKKAVGRGTLTQRALDAVAALLFFWL